MNFQTLNIIKGQQLPAIGNYFCQQTGYTAKALIGHDAAGKNITKDFKTETGIKSAFPINSILKVEADGSAFVIIP